MIGERIREERSRLDLNQSDMADIAGVGKRTIIDWEKDRSSPTAQHLVKLSAVGVDTTYILTGVRTNTAEMFVAQKLAASAHRSETAGDVQGADALFKQALDWQESILQRAEIALKRKESLREISFMLCSLSDDEFEEALKAVSNIHTTALMRRHR